MNIFNKGNSSTSDSVFIEANNVENIKAMSELLKKPNSAEIKKHFLGRSVGANLDIHKIANSQINRHQQALSYRNRNQLKLGLKLLKDGDLESVDLKMLNESITLSPSSQEDVHQYLAFHD